MPSEEKLKRSLEQHEKYPSNVVDDQLQPYTRSFIQACFSGLASDLFQEDRQAKLQLISSQSDGLGRNDTVLSCLAELKDHYNESAGKTQPSSAMFFISAGNSRARLKISKPMFTWLLTYHQVMPRFVEFLTAFGQQDERRDPHLGGFRSRNASSVSDGTVLEVCYTLQSPERDESGHDKWPMRHATLWHRYHFRAGTQTWIVIKANRVLRDALSECCDRAVQDEDSAVKPHLKSLRKALSSHLQACLWSAATWHRYLTDEEKEFQKQTNHVLHADFSRLKTQLTLQTRTSSFATSQKPELPWGSMWPFLQRLRRLDGKRQRASKSNDEKPGTVAGAKDSEKGDVLRFHIGNLQYALEKEERIVTASMALKSNAAVIRELQARYGVLLGPMASGEQLDPETVADITAFIHELQQIIDEYGMLQEHAATLLHVVKSRTSFYHAIIQAQDTQATLEVSEDAANSANSMHELAQQTQKETVRMRIITVVTLFFLPGTFVSTLMSTQVVRYPEDTPTQLRDGIVGCGALQLYVLISVPLMVMTFLSWFVIHKREVRRDRKLQEAALSASAEV